MAKRLVLIAGSRVSAGATPRHLLRRASDALTVELKKASATDITSSSVSGWETGGQTILRGKI
jgi:hypothetical protein